MGNRLKVAGKLLSRAKAVLGEFVHWWLRHDRQYRVKWRLANAAAALLMISSVALPILQQHYLNKRYQLNADTLKLVGRNNQALADKLKYNAKDKTYEFNKEAVKAFNPAAPASVQVGGGGKDTKSLYALDVAEDFSKGVTYHDVNSQLDFKLVPQFNSLAGKTEQGRIVFPLDGGPQAVYTLKNNGLKEDIVVSGNKQATLRFAYMLQLPRTLEAKSLPDGGIGIYSGDPTLFSNMSYGSDKDRQLVEKARENAEKTNLVFGIPAPTITTRDGKQGSASARFELNGNTLTVVAEDLTDIAGPFSIDPSVVVTSTSDFATNSNDEGNIDFSANQISRGTLTGGTLGSWSAANGGTASFARINPNVVAYQGYLYIAGGFTVGSPNTQLNDISYAAINSTTGQLGNWSSASNFFIGGRYQTTLLGYNGYLYMIGGASAANTAFDDAQYALICTGSNSGVGGCGSTPGDLGTWFYANGTLTQAGSTGVDGSKLNARAASAPTFVYNDHIYVVGGCNATPMSSCNASGNTITQVAAINANGTIGIWSNSAAGIPSTMYIGGGAVAYNGVAYLVGGCSAKNGLNVCTAWTSHRAPIGVDGTLGTWVALDNAVPLSDNTGSVTVYKSYLYYSLEGATNKVAYTQINANGSVGPWAFATAYGTARYTSTSALYNGYIYLVEGCTNSSLNCQSPNGSTADIQFAKIDTPGTITSFTQDSDTILTSPNGIFKGGSTIYNGFIYVLGGNDGTGWTNQVRYAQLNADGSTGTWTISGNTFLVPRSTPAATAYNGYLYVAGGQAPGGATADCVVSGASLVYCRDIQKAPINSDGSVGTWVSAGGYYAGAGNPGRDGLGMAAYDGYMYVVGGNYNQNSNVSTEVDIAQINPDGTVGTWSQNTTALGATGRSNFQLAQYGRYLYIAGGRLSGSNTDNSVIYAALSNGGGMSAWGSAGSNFTTARVYNFAAAYNGYLYIAAGDNGTTGNVGKSDIQYAAIDPTTGALSSGWSTLPVTIPTARSDTQGGIYNGYFYIVGGCSNMALFGGCSTVLNDVEYAQVNNGGNGMPTLGSQNIASGVGRGAFGTAVYNGYMYRVGGCSSVLFTNVNTCGSGSIRDDVNYAQINSDGTMGAWQTGTALSTGTGVTARFGLGAVAYNGRLYAVGGCSAVSSGNCTSLNADTQYIDINSNGSLGASWSVAGNTFTNGRYGLSAVVNKGYMYVLGGCSAMTSDNCSTVKSDVQVSQLDATTGLPGTWSSAGSDFTTGRFYQSAVIYSNNLYVLGGCSSMASGNCTGFLDDVQFRPINTSTGALSGSWTYTRSLPSGRYGTAVVANNGYMYVVGGCGANGTANCTNYLGDVQYASISSTGDLNHWSTTAGTVLGTTRFLHGAAIVNNTLVVVGGNMPTNSFGTAQQSGTIAVMPRTATFSKFIDLGRSTNTRSITYNGTASTVTLSYKAASSSNGVFDTASSASASIAPTGTCTGNVSQKRYLELIVNIDDAQTAAYGETTGSIVTDVTVQFYYTHVAPQIRLRGGQTLQAGEHTPLDTCDGMSPI